MEIGPAIGLTGLVLSIPGLIDGCITYSRRLQEKVQQLKNARVILKEKEEEYDIFTKQVSASLLFVNDIWASLSEELKETVQKAVLHLHNAFRSSLDLIERSVDDTGALRKWWFVLYGKPALDKCLRDIYKRHDIFLRCLHYSVIFGGSVVTHHITKEHLHSSTALSRIRRLSEAVLNRSLDDPLPIVLLRPADLPSGLRRPIHHHSTIMRIVMADGTTSRLLIEYRAYDPADNSSLRRIRDIAAILHGTDVTMNILPCLGFFPRPDSSLCELVFPLPPGFGNPRTLRDLLLSPENARGVRHSLTRRVTLAIQVATGVLYVHSAKLVHKNIRPENIVLLERDGDRSLKYPDVIGESYLMGFDFARKEDGASSRAGDEDWEKNIYRHPQRQGLHPEAEFNMLHDIYSLGVVLLEIALWKSFVLYAFSNTGVTCVPNTSACKFTDKATGRLKPPRDIQEGLMKKAQDYIPLVLGDKYRDIVLKCLNCLNGGFGDSADLYDEDGVTVGLVFIQKVLAALEEIAL